MTIPQVMALGHFCDNAEMPKEIRRLSFNLARHDFTQLNRWILVGAWKPDIIKALEDSLLYDEQIEGMILSECIDAEISL